VARDGEIRASPRRRALLANVVAQCSGWLSPSAPWAELAPLASAVRPPLAPALDSREEWYNFLSLSLSLYLYLLFFEGKTSLLFTHCYEEEGGGASGAVASVCLGGPHRTHRPQLVSRLGVPPRGAGWWNHGRLWGRRTNEPAVLTAARGLWLG
jgi:hypothetical protein